MNYRSLNTGCIYSKYISRTQNRLIVLYKFYFTMYTWYPITVYLYNVTMDIIYPLAKFSTIRIWLIQQYIYILHISSACSVYFAKFIKAYLCFIMYLNIRINMCCLLIYSVNTVLYNSFILSINIQKALMYLVLFHSGWKKLKYWILLTQI